MQLIRGAWTLLVLAALVAALGGCRPAEPEKPKQPAPAEVPPAEAVKPKPAPQAEKPAEPEPPKPTMPKVALSEEFKETNKVRVGDKLPDGELPDLSGNKQPITKLLGKKFTVVFFWTADSSYSITELEDLQADVYGPLAAKGGQVVGINVDQDPQKARQAVEKTGAKFPMLMDPAKDYFDKLASEKLLRTYLIDPQGKILWFDLEYSRSTQRDLRQAIEFLMAGGS